MSDPNVTTFGPEFRIRPTASASAGERLSEWAPFVGQGADVTTTIIGLKRGLQEGNPVAAMVTGNVAAFVAVKLGVAVVAHLLVKNLRENGHPGWAKALGWFTFAEGAIPAALNVHTIQRS